MLKRFVFALFAALFAVFCLCNCTKKDGREKLCDLLFSQRYEAEFDFCFSDKNGSPALSGSARATKDGKTRIDFLAPELFSSLSVESDESGDTGVLIFNYYGMRTPLPDNALSRVSALLSVFSDEIPKKAMSREAKISKPTNDGEKAHLSQCSFLLDEKCEISIVFDKISGFPTEITKKCEDFDLCITFTKITPPDSLTEEAHTS